jgi:hypothetical protein
VRDGHWGEPVALSRQRSRREEARCIPGLVGHARYGLKQRLSLRPEMLADVADKCEQVTQSFPVRVMFIRSYRSFPPITP